VVGVSIAIGVGACVSIGAMISGMGMLINIPNWVICEFVKSAF